MKPLPRNVLEESFSFEGNIGHIQIIDAYTDLPRYGRAIGLLYKETIDEADIMVDRDNIAPIPVGRDEFIVSGTGGPLPSSGVRIDVAKL